MRLYSGKVKAISSDIVRALRSTQAIECSHTAEVEQDVEAVLNNYVRTEKEAVDKAKDLMAARGLGNVELARMKKLIAEQMGIKVGDETLDYLLDQLVEILMHSNHVDEIFAEDVELRRQMVPVLKKHMAMDDEMDKEARGKLKHMEEGTRSWEIEYARVMEDIRRRRGAG